MIRPPPKSGSGWLAPGGLAGVPGFPGEGLIAHHLLPLSLGAVLLAVGVPIPLLRPVLTDFAICHSDQTPDKISQNQTIHLQRSQMTVLARDISIIVRKSLRCKDKLSMFKLRL